MQYLVIIVLAGIIIIEVAIEVSAPRTKRTEEQDRRAMLRAIERIERKP